MIKIGSLIRKWDLHCQVNNTAHHTQEIQLIVRRGQPFLLSLEMSQAFQTFETLVLSVETGPPPSERHGTRSEFGNPSPMYTSDVKAIWRYAFDKSANLQRGVVTLSVTPPADAPVGKYSLSAKTERGKTSLGTLVVLFNPWCSDDWVYLPDERERQEYVMNEYGIVCVGTSHSIAGRPWDFGQFEEEMVDICLKLLDVNPKYLRDPADDVSARCNPIYVSRVISAMINSNGDQGVLVGRWHGDYSDGVTPTRWTGSVDILQKWCKLNCHPVKYGQCWVFATVMCSVMRFFGIPCRVVTNFESAHDENNSLTIDRVYNKYGMKGAEESIWNFHVWVEGWMKRPDLMKGTAYDGWQVLDPTPQELSEGTHCCGPAPVSGILQGEVNLKYDTPFVFSEVNADIIKWMESDNGSRRKIYSDTTRVGRNISTKAVGRYMRDDITNSYKHREGSKDERAVFDRAMCRVNSKDDEDENRPVLKVDMKIEEETKIVSGQDIKLKLKLRSKDRTNRKMDIYINAQAMRYNGITTSNIHNSLQVQEILAGTDVIIPIQIPFSKYGRYMVGCDSMKVSVMAVDQQQQDDIFETETDIVLEGSPIIIKRSPRVATR
ncbi:LOW QUALITY PROTEIN: protein-glutamine gamma-glutamyltransferase 2-like [Aulostomus maculatus]